MKREVIELPAKDPADIQTRRRQLRVAAYCRVSTSLEAQQNSYEAQKEYYTNKILSNPDWTLAGIFCRQGHHRHFRRKTSWFSAHDSLVPTG